MSQFHDLPNEIILKVLTYLKVKELLCCGQTSKRIRAVSHDQTLYQEIRKRSYGETSQFQENFEVYMQSLISQCLDADFLDEVFNDEDEYFVSNIEKVDSVTFLRKDKVLNGISWSMRFQHALSTWPYFNDLGASAVQDSQCTLFRKAYILSGSGFLEFLYSILNRKF